jgi:hypothetical protein
MRRGGNPNAPVRFAPGVTGEGHDSGWEGGEYGEEDPFNQTGTGMDVDAEQEGAWNEPPAGDASLMSLAGNSMMYDQANGKIYIDGEQKGPGAYYLWDGVWANLMPNRDLIVTTYNAIWATANHEDSIFRLAPSVSSLLQGDQPGDAPAGIPDPDGQDYTV